MTYLRTKQTHKENNMSTDSAYEQQIEADLAYLKKEQETDDDHLITHNIAILRALRRRVHARNAAPKQPSTQPLAILGNAPYHNTIKE